jgi:hypothetical protein
MDIVIEIDELVLHGFPAADRHRIADAVQAELTRIVGERGLSGAWADGAAVRLDGGSFQAADGRPGTVGAGVAEAVYRTVAGAPPGSGAIR